MEFLVMAFMAAVIGCLLWIGSEIKQLNKKLDIENDAGDHRNNESLRYR